MGRPPGSKNKDKPWADAIRLEAAAAAVGEDCVAPAGSLRWMARQTLIRGGEETAAAREIGDRLDGKPSQSVELSGDLTLTHEEALEQLD